MTRNTWMWGAAALLATALLLGWAFAPRAVEVEVATATEDRFQTTIDEDGKTRLRERFTVSAPLTGRLERIQWREGDWLEAGTVVATLTPVLSPLLDERSARELQARLEAAQAGLERSSVRIERAKVALAQTQQELRRNEQLARQGFVSASKLDVDQLAVQAAEKEVETALQDQHVARHDVAQAQAALSAVRPVQGAHAPSRFEVRAPARGRVLRILQSSEASVTVGTALLEMGDTTQMEIVAELLTSDALKAVPGSQVRIVGWGGPGVLQGRVRRTEPAAFTKVSALGVEEQRVKVLIDITSPPEQWTMLGDGFHVSLRIVTLTVERALVVPVSAVFPMPSRVNPSNEKPAPAEHAVFVVENGRAVLRPVQLGGRNGSQAWLRGGLNANATVVVYPPPRVVDGVRVKPRKV
ncbi:MAG: efflux RND transporter periplasmic adaptor subunit [Burkholderiales bacterium]